MPIDEVVATPAGMGGGDPVSILEGSRQAKRAVIAFAGIMASLGGVELQEFSKSLSTTGDGSDVLQRPVAFVRERPPRWYNSIETRRLQAFVAEQANRTIVTLGNSMGGFAAIRFSLLLPGIRRSIAFCPQFSVHPTHCPWETRWREEVAAIDGWRFETCLSGAGDPYRGELDHVVFCGSAIPDDVRHVEMIVEQATQPVSAFVVHGCGHDVASYLKRRQALVPLLDLLIDDLASHDDIVAYLQANDLRFDMLGSG